MRLKPNELVWNPKDDEGQLTSHLITVVRPKGHVPTSLEDFLVRQTAMLERMFQENRVEELGLLEEAEALWEERPEELLMGLPNLKVTDPKFPDRLLQYRVENKMLPLGEFQMDAEEALEREKTDPHPLHPPTREERLEIEDLNVGTYLAKIML